MNIQQTFATKVNVSGRSDQTPRFFISSSMPHRNTDASESAPSAHVKDVILEPLKPTHVATHVEAGLDGDSIGQCSSATSIEQIANHRNPITEQPMLKPDSEALSIAVSTSQTNSPVPTQKRKDMKKVKNIVLKTKETLSNTKVSIQTIILQPSLQLVDPQQVKHYDEHMLKFVLNSHSSLLNKLQ